MVTVRCEHGVFVSLMVCRHTSFTQLWCGKTVSQGGRIPLCRRRAALVALCDGVGLVACSQELQREMETARQCLAHAAAIGQQFVDAMQEQ